MWIRRLLAGIFTALLLTACSKSPASPVLESVDLTTPAASTTPGDSTPQAVDRGHMFGSGT